MTDSFITTPDGVRLFVRTLGEPTGHSALLIPNGIAYLDDLASLAEDRQIVAFDLRNRGWDWVAKLPHAQLLYVPNAAHAPWLEDAFVLPAIRRFLSGN